MSGTQTYFILRGPALGEVAIRANEMIEEKGTRRRTFTIGSNLVGEVTAEVNAWWKEERRSLLVPQPMPFLQGSREADTNYTVKYRREEEGSSPGLGEAAYRDPDLYPRW